MKITFKMDGGFAHIPALSGPHTIDTTQQAPQAANELEALVRECNFFELPAQANTAPKGAADNRRYTITIEDGSRIHTVHLADPVADVHLNKLVSQLRTKATPSKP